jgi:hypothetical protein
LPTIISSIFTFLICLTIISSDDGGRENKKIESFKWKSQESTVLFQKSGVPGCASGGFLADGSFILTGAAIGKGEFIKKFSTQSTDYEETWDKIDSFRWYAGSVTAPNGNLILIGGSVC